jgi:hypothetical protein
VAVLLGRRLSAVPEAQPEENDLLLTKLGGPIHFSHTVGVRNGSDLGFGIGPGTRLFVFFYKSLSPIKLNKLPGP